MIRVSKTNLWLAVKTAPTTGDSSSDMQIRSRENQAKTTALRAHERRLLRILQLLVDCAVGAVVAIPNYLAKNVYSVAELVTFSSQPVIF
jgi:hypothetical protein